MANRKDMRREDLSTINPYTYRKVTSLTIHISHPIHPHQNRRKPNRHVLNALLNPAHGSNLHAQQDDRLDSLHLRATELAERDARAESDGWNASVFECWDGAFECGCGKLTLYLVALEFMTMMRLCEIC